MTQRPFHISLSLVACLFLAACTGGFDNSDLSMGPCTLAPNKATSRPYQINGVWYYPQSHFEYDEVGLASYYGGGDVFHGRPTATGEIFDMNGITGAHKTLPLPCIAEITNLENGRQLNIKINDRGPFIEGRVIDVSRRVAQLLGFEGRGLAKVRVRTLVPQSLALNNLEAPTVMMATAPAPILLAEPQVAPSRPATGPSIADQIEKYMFAAASLSTPARASPLPKQTPLSSSSAKPSPPSTKGIFVDVGGYQTHDEAKTASTKLAHVAHSPMRPIKGNGPKPYTIRVGPLASMFTANQVLDQLIEAGHRTSRIVIHR